jgi:hypothetical protein
MPSEPSSGLPAASGLATPLGSGVFRTENSGGYLARHARDVIGRAQVASDADIVGAVQAQLHRLQEDLDAHLVSDAAGRCVACLRAEPCRRRDELTVAILAFGALPRRRPGLTMAGLRRTEIR